MTSAAASDRVDVVIVNWNTGDVLRQCLESLASARNVGTVVVVDNDSADTSLEVSAAALEALDSKVIVNRENVGFARACNQGAAESAADYLLFLNPDTRVRDDSLRTVVDFFESPAGRSFAICGVRMLDADGRPAIPGGPFPTLRLIVGDVTRLTRVAPRLFPARHSIPASGDGPVDHVIGAFLAIRRSVFEQLGGFDEQYFMYYEEVDLCRRCRDIGWGTYHREEGDVVHIGNVSSQQIRGKRLFYSLRSRRQFATVHWSTSARRGLFLVEFGIELPARMAREMRAGRSLVPRETILGYRSYLGSLRDHSDGR